MDKVINLNKHTDRIYTAWIDDSPWHGSLEDFDEFYTELSLPEPMVILPAVHLYTPESGDDYTVYKEGGRLNSPHIKDVLEHYASRDSGCELTAEEVDELCLYLIKK